MNYLDPHKLTKLIVNYQTDPDRYQQDVGDAILLLCTKISSCYVLSNHPLRDDLIANGCLKCLKCLKTYNHTKGNAFNYLSAAAKMGFLEVFRKEKQQKISS